MSDRLPSTTAARCIRTAGRAARIVATATALTALIGAPSATAWATGEGAPLEVGPVAAGDQGAPLPLVLA